MMTKPETIYYVYLLARPNGKVFYVGKGQGNRILDHEGEARRGCKCHKCNIIRKIWKGGGEIQRYTVLTTTDEQEAFKYEMELIALYGRENLVNKTNGGEGGTGRIVSGQARERLSIQAKERMSNPKTRIHLSELAKIRMSDPQRREILRQKQKELSAHPDVRAERSRKLRDFFAQNVEARERLAAQSKKASAARYAKPGSRERNQAQLQQLRQANTGKPLSPERKAKISEARKAYFARLREEKAREQSDS